MSKPVLSIAVAASGESESTVFMQALADQGILNNTSIEIQLAADQSAGLDGQFADNVSLQVCQPGTSILQLWGRALANCRADYVAVLDIKCPPLDGWLQTVQAQIDNGTAVFYGPVDCAWRNNDVRIIGYLVEYAQFHSPLPVSLHEVPGNNIACRRELLDKNENLRTNGFYKTFMIWRLREQGIEPVAVDDMRVAYRKPFILRHYLARRYTHGRCFGATRHDNAGQPNRWLCAAFTPLLPWLRCWRIFQAVRHHAHLHSAFWRFGWQIAASECAWSLGELAGYVIGGRHCCDRLD